MPRQRWIIGIAVDAATIYGRAVARGVLQYANVRREWLIHQETRPASEAVSRWPDCDGAIFAGQLSNVIEQLCRKSRHVVSCSGATDPAIIPVVCADGAAIGRMAAEHLLDRQLRRFAYYGREDRISNDRGGGFRGSIEARGYPCDELRIKRMSPDEMLNHSHWGDVIQWLDRLPKPVGIFAVDDSVAHDLAAICLKADITVPDQVAIVGVNNDDLLCEGAWPPLSSIQVDFSRVGALAARQLDRLLQGETLSENERVIHVPPLRLVQRMSTDIRSVNDPELAQTLAYIREHACDPCTVIDILRHVPVSRSWLDRQFTEKLGRSPHDEIIRVRMERARLLLLESDESLPQIAARCGFNATQNFSRAFCSAHGLTPAAYRRKHR